MSLNKLQMDQRTFVKEHAKRLKLSAPFLSDNLIKSRANDAWIKMQNKHEPVNVIKQGKQNVRKTPNQQRREPLRELNQNFNTDNDCQAKRKKVSMSQDDLFDYVRQLNPPKMVKDVYDFNDDVIPSTFPEEKTPNRFRQPKRKVNELEFNNQAKQKKILPKDVLNCVPQLSPPKTVNNRDAIPSTFPEKKTTNQRRETRRTVNELRFTNDHQAKRKKISTGVEKLDTVRQLNLPNRFNDVVIPSALPEKRTPNQRRHLNELNLKFNTDNDRQAKRKEMGRKTGDDDVFGNVRQLSPPEMVNDISKFDDDIIIIPSTSPEKSKGNNKKSRNLHLTPKKSIYKPIPEGLNPNENKSIQNLNSETSKSVKYTGKSNQKSPQRTSTPIGHKSIGQSHQKSPQRMLTPIGHKSIGKSNQNWIPKPSAQKSIAKLRTSPHSDPTPKGRAERRVTFQDEVEKIPWLEFLEDEEIDEILSPEVVYETQFITGSYSDREKKKDVEPVPDPATERQENGVKPLTLAIEKFIEKLRVPDSGLMNLEGRVRGNEDIYWKFMICTQPQDDFLNVECHEGFLKLRGNSEATTENENIETQPQLMSESEENENIENQHQVMSESEEKEANTSASPTCSALKNDFYVQFNELHLRSETVIGEMEKLWILIDQTLSEIDLQFNWEKQRFLKTANRKINKPFLKVGEEKTTEDEGLFCAMFDDPPLDSRYLYGLSEEYDDVFEI